jgi:lauroyl/myristoyl acyltransferase
MDASSQALKMLTSPGLWELLAPFEPPAAVRIVHSVLRELSTAAFVVGGFEALADRLSHNASVLGITVPASSKGRFARRCLDAELWREAASLVCLFADAHAQVAWFHATTRVRGGAALTDAVRAGRPAVLISAHLGPMTYYIPLVAFHLAKHELATEIVAVVNAPSAEHERHTRAQLERYAKFHGSKLSLVGKREGDEAGLLKTLTEALRRGALVTMQVDVLSGGRSQTPVPIFGRELLLPGVRGVARLSAHYGVPVIPLRMSWAKGRSLALTVDKPIDAGDTEQRVRAIAVVLERWVLAAPAQWGMLGTLHRMLPAPT